MEQIMKKKYAIVILDGASGEPLTELGGLTSLEAAHTPYLDALAKAGELGLAKNVPDELEPSSNVACMSICGLDPSLYPIGRGALEGAALGIDLQPDEVAMRLNLCNVSDDGIMISYSTDNISSKDGHALIGEIAAELDNETFTLHKGAGFRGILVVKGHLELMQSEFAAAHNMTDELVAAYPPTGPKAALITRYQAMAKKILAQSPTNARRVQAGQMPATDVFVFWPGMRPAGMQSFKTLYNKDAGMLSGVDLLNGISRLAGIREYHFAGVTDGPDNDYAAQGEGALAMLEQEDVVIIHVESPDAEGHDGNALGKKAAIEAIDREIISRLIDYGQKPDVKLRILALPDHPTPVTRKRHTRELVPYVLVNVTSELCLPEANFNVEKPTNQDFQSLEAKKPALRLTEAASKASGIVANPGHQLMAKLLS
ncbi:MAG: 2,3-bisphosphoglycerate-independent phosphoglycerate mutase [Coriobacteriales bacterium]|jgi:2,3-bisphosphoglycerate-independent phosphoglycerate mutase|nr:2,3-bisphosphoglycerate-independent phosphoglycerate mutase [Coriobacteriales bacterium]